MLKHIKKDELFRPFLLMKHLSLIGISDYYKTGIEPFALVNCHIEVRKINRYNDYFICMSYLTN